ncbi:MAG: elongation factor P maturation arginine rhamnosyltransferase EarP [Zhongshania sp.]|uniref:elongation factor P maturation arginine rhamnosyltransferase EarP n=1 Tax=Zhongshania sp. TaxID=1971902 RepID=UPI0026027CEB|nr:elongation factor P maturation arginine rhamnosyltransferase EarP [Zhongshania sp.]MDF1693959.1 elongation factor P maturation arginine rhamnosyltransferase EarP [Zhongshania sp.]
MRFTWDIFCTVIDNFGDIGVTWRLARQLAAEHDLDVRLWVDDLGAFVRLCPSADASLAVQEVQGVVVHYWAAPWSPVAAADVVIEAFACELPPAYIAAMQGRERPSLWLNLEYLSAEAWVDDCHGLPSPQGKGLQKYFFFPGFSTRSGGLLREAGLIARRRAFQCDIAAQQAFLHDIGVARASGHRLISLFCYENSALSSLLDALAESVQPSLLLVPEGCVSAGLKSYFGVEHVSLDHRYERGALTVQLIPFLSQQDYDYLLWSCDLNFVRGEDSFIRAQWAERPFIWHIYPQQDKVHIDKLQAFLDRFSVGLDGACSEVLSALSLDWNEGRNMAQSWRRYDAASPVLAGHAADWSARLAEGENLADSLVQFHQNWL